MTQLLQADNVHVEFDGRRVVDGVSLQLDSGEIVALVGPNGAGKSTLLRAVRFGLGSGDVAWFGKPLADWPGRRLARQIGWLAQEPAFEPRQRVVDCLAGGRAAHWGPFGVESSADRQAVADVADRLSLKPWLQRPVDELSGGERRRVLLGRTLVQIETSDEAAVLLDEPDAFLDLVRVAELAATLRDQASRGRGVLLASHDLNLAAAVADRVVLMASGRVVASGEPSDVLCADQLQEAYGDAAEVHAVDGRRVVIPRLPPSS
ncbi:MAG: ABC transporter ATP-binding protein [Planctomycetota bacterium]